MDKPSEIKFRLRTFTCSEIEEILKDSSNVRDMSAATRDRYLQSMLDGTWNCANGDTIVFDKQGNLIDGQHRLSAAYIYQKTQGDSVWFWCADNCKTEAALTKDQGLLRSLSALLKRDGVSRASRCSSIVISQLRLQENRRRIGSLKTIKTKAVLSEQYRCWLDNKEDISICAKIAERAKDAKLSRSTLIGMIVYEIRRLCGDDALTFADRLTKGVELIENDPILRLRQRLLKDHAEKHNRMSAEMAISLIVMAWNYWIKGETIRVLSWRGTGPRAMPAPEIYVPSKEDDAE